MIACVEKIVSDLISNRKRYLPQISSYQAIFEGYSENPISAICVSVD
jgi:hypothetical protein